MHRAKQDVHPDLPLHKVAIPDPLRILPALWADKQPVFAMPVQRPQFSNK